MPPFLESNFVSLLSHTDISAEDSIFTRGTNLEGLTLLAADLADSASEHSIEDAKVGDPMERTLSPVRVDVAPAEHIVRPRGRSSCSIDTSKKRAAATVKQEDCKQNDMVAKRMKRNRASADRSRLRKQAYLEEVEFKLSVATSENLILRERVMALETELCGTHGT